MATQQKFIPPTLAPDLQRRQMDLQRNQMLAQQLLQSEAPQGQMVSGHYVAPSITQHLAHALRQYQGGKAMRDIPEQEAALQQAQHQQMMGQFGFGQPSPQQYASALSGSESAQPLPIGDQPGQHHMGPQGGQGPILIPGMDKQQSMLALQTLGPAEYMKLVAKGNSDRGTSAMQNAVAMGLQPGTPEYAAAIERMSGRPSTTVNIGQSEYGTIPPGYELFTNPKTGTRSMRPISGGPVDREEQEAATRAEAAKRNAADYARTVTQDIGIALEELGNYGTLSRMNNPVGGLIAESSSRIPRTSEYNMRQFVDSALSNVTLDTMNRMRETSPAGATGFGNMSERQMDVIRGVLGQWKPGLPVEQQQYILHRLHNFYMDVVVGSKEERNQAVRDGRMTRAEADAMDDLYYPETRDLKGRRLADQGSERGSGSGDIPRIQSQGDLQSLPSGSIFIAPDGSTRRKP